MSKSLAAYLHDHLAGAKFAIHLLDMLAGQHAHEPLGSFAAALKPRLEEDKATLESIVDRVGTTGIDTKQIAAWVVEKAGEFKLRRSSACEFGSFEALETLGIGILGKLALWRVLSDGAAMDVRLSAVDYNALIDRAEQQFAAVEAFRLESARAAFEWRPAVLQQT